MQGGFPPALAGVFLQDHHVPEVVGVLNHVIQSQSSPYRFGTFRCVSASEVPPRVRELVSHTDNLTLVLERFCHTRFEIDVVSKLKDSKKCFYSRQVLLRVPGEEGEAEQGNGQEGDGALGGDVDMEGAVLGGCAVSLGVICVDLAAMRPEVRRDIESERVPFGRILENHGVKREVKVDQLWKVNADRDSHLWTLFHNRHFSSHTNGTDLHTYGRTVEMTCDGKPAVLVLEVLNLPPLQAVALARGIRLDEPANEQPDGGKTRFGMAAEAGERDREREEGGR
ncbi:unnamed protein product [Vitrella brassicaformis CCMP3155]|uniref:Uncharacterized protein n=1 Tax=Vitrella brassicaformis (strain CCMP3155) TaxID=1169540 RepID=A0A0G4FM45_VITBC|nr:unnamed protein product [Vitrella brassicaformis CCMP3155]|eukprot:CEM14604.1 unnamed protein product [Vitrella brassicaformis CCMP3155]